MYDHILIRYGELALKGRNQMDFIRQLVKNIRGMVERHQGGKIKLEIEQGRLFLELEGENPEKYYESLSKVFGIFSFSPVRKGKLDMEEIKIISLEEFQSITKKPDSFRVTVKRSNKRFPVKSPDAQIDIGGYIYENSKNLRVDLHNPDVEVFVEIRDDAAYIYTQKLPGLGGLPLGTGGKAMLLLSGGIDSPVAGWLTMKRGVVIEAIHFYSFPYTSERAKEKVIELARVLAEFSGKVVVHMVPFTKIQEAISANCYESLWITIMRRFMFRIAERITHQRKALALVTGESLGQVASQTLDSIYAINNVIDTPVIRPLITSDKEEIMGLARKIDTYEISIRPYEDCCTVFLPKEPKTKPKMAICEKEETRLDKEGLIEDALVNTERIMIKAQEHQLSFGIK
ncbi:MAG: thiamine biosynthesis protein ThiI [Peptococcaceae bacterium BICA1-8]|nr:MAG: thiamine biosynthesis protein ThiI [Peptococcaceae bacterium BICA1-8]